MRVAYVPMYSSPHNIQTCSSFNFIRMVAMSIVQNRDCHLYLCVPDSVSDRAWVEEQLKHPRLTIIYVPAYKNQHREMTWLPGEIIKRFAEMGGDLYIDALLTDKTVAVPYFREALHTWTENGTGGITIAVVDRFFLREVEHNYQQEGWYRDQAFGHASADLICWTTKNVQTDAMNAAKKWLSFSEIKKMREKSIFSYSSLDIERMKPFIVERDPNDPVRVVNYAYALSSGYKWQDNLEMFDYLFARGNRNVKILVTTATLMEGIFPERWSNYMEIHQGLPRNEFWKKISTAHAFVHLPQYVQLSQSVLEQQMLGIVGVFPNRPWAYDMTYPGYPYIGKDKVEMGGMLRHVIDNYFTDEVQDVIKKQREFICERFDGVKCAVGLYDAVKKITPDRMPGAPGDLPALCHAIFKDIPVGATVTYDEWKEKIKDNTRVRFNVDKAPMALQGVCKNRWRKATLMVGFKDDFSNEKPTFIRVVPADQIPAELIDRHNVRLVGGEINLQDEQRIALTDDS